MSILRIGPENFGPARTFWASVQQVAPHGSLFIHFFPFHTKGDVTHYFPVLLFLFVCFTCFFSQARDVC